MCVFERNKLKGFESLLQTQKLRFSNSYTFATQPCRDTGFKNLSCDEVLQYSFVFKENALKGNKTMIYLINICTNSNINYLQKFMAAIFTLKCSKILWFYFKGSVPENETKSSSLSICTFINIFALFYNKSQLHFIWNKLVTYNFVHKNEKEWKSNFLFLWLYLGLPLRFLNFIFSERNE